jgi:hypothetical protein
MVRSLVCINDSTWFLKAWFCCSRLFLVVIFGAMSWWISWCVFETFLLGIWWGMYAWTLRGSFPFDSPPKFVSKGAPFWGFRCSRVRGAFGGISSIPLDLASFGGHKLGYGLCWGVTRKIRMDPRTRVSQRVLSTFKHTVRMQRDCDSPRWLHKFQKIWIRLHVPSCPLL